MTIFYLPIIWFRIEISFLFPFSFVAYAQHLSYSQNVEQHLWCLQLSLHLGGGCLTFTTIQEDWHYITVQSFFLVSKEILNFPSNLLSFCKAFFTIQMRVWISILCIPSFVKTYFRYIHFCACSLLTFQIRSSHQNKVTPIYARYYVKQINSSISCILGIHLFKKNYISLC